MSGKFTSLALDQLIKDATEDVDEIANDLANYDQNNIAPAVSPEINNMVNKETGGESVDFTRVYAQLERLISNGNTALDTLNSLEIDMLSPEIISATTSLMNSIKNCISEFTKIHLNHIKFMQKLKLMEQEQANKKELLKMKADLNKEKTSETFIDAEQKIEVGDGEIISFIRHKMAKQAIENKL